MTTATYTTTLEFARFLNIVGTVPAIDPAGASRAREVVGVGDGSNKLFYLNYGRVIASTYNIYYGATESAALANELTETTHYTLDKDTGNLTLTSAGATLVSTNNIYADYKYILIELTDTQLQEALDRAQSQINETTKQIWVDGTSATPAYGSVSNEAHRGKGMYDREYYTKKYPLPNVSTAVEGTAVAIGDTTINVDSTDGFPSSGVIGIGSEKIVFSAKTSTTFTVTAVTAAHAVDDEIKPYVVEISTTESGSEPAWTVLDENSEYDIDLENGRIHLFFTDYDLMYTSLQYPQRLLPNRFRISYLYGNDTIPEDITRLCLMIATKDLLHLRARRNVVNGMNALGIEQIDVDELWIKQAFSERTITRSDNI